MKTHTLKKLSVLVAMLGCSGAALAESAQLNVYNWSEYIAKDTIPSFEKTTGIRVKYDVYDGDDTLQAKLLTGNTGYDIVVPTSNYMARQIDAGIFRKLDKSKIPNLKNLDPNLMKLAAVADPGNQYGVPWAWGTDGIGYNVNKVEAVLGKGAPTDSWALLFEPKYVSKLKSCGVSMLDQAADVFASTLVYMGRDPNSTNAADYEAAFKQLKTIRPYVTQFSSTGYIGDMAGGDICVALGWSGDMGNAKRRAAEAKKPYEIRFSNPKEGGLVWFSMMVVPKDAPHPDAAMQWINHSQDPKVNAQFTNEVFYPTANAAAKPYVVASAGNSGVFPSHEVFKRLTLMKPLPAAILRLENRLWTQFKSNR